MSSLNSRFESNEEEERMLRLRCLACPHNLFFVGGKERKRERARESERERESARERERAREREGERERAGVRERERVRERARKGGRERGRESQGDYCQAPPNALHLFPILCENGIRLKPFWQ